MSNTSNLDTVEDKTSNRISKSQDATDAMDAEITDSSMEELEEAYIRDIEQDEYIHDEVDNARIMMDWKHKTLQNVSEMDELDMYEQEKERIGSSLSYKEDENTLCVTFVMLHSLFGKVKIEKTDIGLYPIRSYKYFNVCETKKVSKINKTLNLYQNSNSQTTNGHFRQIGHFLSKFSSRKRNFVVELDDVINGIVDLIGYDIMMTTEMTCMLHSTRLSHGGVLFSKINVQAEMTSFNIKKAVLGYTNENQENMSLLAVQTIMKSSKSLHCVRFIQKHFYWRELAGFKKHILIHIPLIKQSVVVPRFYLPQKVTKSTDLTCHRMMENFTILIGVSLYCMMTDDDSESLKKNKVQVRVSDDADMASVTCPEELTIKKHVSSGSMGLSQHIIAFFVMYEAANYVYKQTCFSNHLNILKLIEVPGVKTKKSSKNCTQKKMVYYKINRNLTEQEDDNDGKFYFSKMIRMLAYMHDETFHPKHFNSKSISYYLRALWKKKCLRNSHDQSYDYLFEIRRSSIPTVTVPVNMEYAAEVMDGELENSTTDGPKKNENQTSEPSKKEQPKQLLDLGDYQNKDMKINMGKTIVTDKNIDQKQSSKDENISPEFQHQGTCSTVHQIVRPKCQKNHTHFTVNIHNAKKGVFPEDIDGSEKLCQVLNPRLKAKNVASSELFGNGQELKETAKPGSIDPRDNHLTTPDSSELFKTEKKSEGERKQRLTEKEDHKGSLNITVIASTDLFGDGVNCKYNQDSVIDSAEIFGDGNKKSPREAVAGIPSDRQTQTENSRIRDNLKEAQKVLRIRELMVEINNGIICGTEEDLGKFFQKKIPSEGVIINENLQRVASVTDFSLKEDVDLYRINRFKPIGFGYYEKIRELGRGSYGVVYLCKADIPGSGEKFEFVLKQIPMNKFNSSEGLIPLRHARYCSQVLKIYGAYKESDNMNILMEYAAGGTLHEVITEDVMDLTGKIICIETLLKGLQYLHSQNIVVYDVKDLNIVLRRKDDPSSVAYIDWGSSKTDRQEGPLIYKNGTPLFLPPEILDMSKENKYFHPSLKGVDMWGLGCVMYRMIAKQNVWKNILSSVKNLQKDQKQNFIPKMIENQRCNIYKEINQMNRKGPDDLRLPSVLHLLSRLLDPYPDSRILSDDALQHLVFSENRRSLIPIPVFDMLGNQSSLSSDDMIKLLDMKTVVRNDQFKVWVTVFYKERVIAHEYIYKGMSGKDLYKHLEEKINNLLVPELKDSEYYFVLKGTSRFCKDCVVELKELKEK